MWPAIATISNIVFWFLNKFGMSKARQDEIKRNINTQVRKIISGPSNSTKVRDQYNEAKKKLDDYLDGKKSDNPNTAPIKKKAGPVPVDTKNKAFCHFCEKDMMVTMVYPDGDRVLNCGHIVSK